MNIAIQLISWGLGGTEKRFPNLLRYLIQKSQNNYYLIINRYLASLLRELDWLKGIEHIVFEVPVSQKAFARFADSTRINIFEDSNIKIPGFDLLQRHLKNFARSICFSHLKFDWISNLDVVHLASASYVGFPYILPKNIPRVIEYQGSTLSFLNSTIADNLLFGKRNVVNIASERIRMAILERFPTMDSERLFVSPCSFIDYSKTRIAPKERLVSFCGSGSLKKKKNPFLFAEAAQRIVTKISDVKFVVMGTGSLEHQMKSFISEMNMEKFFYVGFDPNPSDTFARSMIFVSLQKYDNYHSQSLMEAMACGCAIVASDVGETRRLVSEDVGFRVPLDAEAVAEKVLWLLQNPSKAQKLGRRAREKVMREHTVERYAEYIEQVYKKVSAGFNE